MALNKFGAYGKSSKDKARKGVRPFKVYTALLTQTSSNAPVATVLQNTLSGAIVWTRTNTGVYAGTLASEFVEGKTVVILLNPAALANGSAHRVLFTWVSANAVGIATYSDEYSSAADAVLENTPIEIRVYDN